jgi:Sulfotransferase family
MADGRSLATLQRLPRIAVARGRRALNRGLGTADSRPVGPTSSLQSPPLLILGAPRCGSTLLYQVIVACFDVSYLSNLHCRLYGSPALAERLVRRRRRTHVEYTSLHGTTTGLLAPAECGEFWYRFFRRSPQHVPRGAENAAAMGRLRASISRFQRAAGRPLVFKNLICSLRVGPIAAALPEALFVVVHRDLVENGQSLLAARMQIAGSYADWWSAEPPGVERMRGLTPEQQVVEQVRGVYSAIDAERDQAGAGRFLDLSYEDLCRQPESMLQDIAEFARNRGLTLKRVGDPPPSFATAGGVRIDPVLYSRLVAAAERH